MKYQIDAIKYGIDCINKNNGVIIADVVGLGKSVVASAIAYNLNIKRTIIIAPPHFVDQWNEYQQDFGLRGVKICSSGRIEELYKNHASDPNSSQQNRSAGNKRICRRFTIARDSISNSSRT